MNYIRRESEACKKLNKEESVNTAISTNEPHSVQIESRFRLTRRGTKLIFTSFSSTTYYFLLPLLRALVFSIVLHCRRFFLSVEKGHRVKDCCRHYDPANIDILSAILETSTAFSNGESLQRTRKLHALIDLCSDSFDYSTILKKRQGRFLGYCSLHRL